MTPFVAHLRRHEAENLTDKFASAPPGTFEKTYTLANYRKRLDEPGWCRVWVIKDGEKIVAHASLYDLGEPDGVVFGHIGIERPYRHLGYAKPLNKRRLALCDKHNLTLCGAVAYGNDASFHGCRRVGFEFLRYDTKTRETWVYRPPQPPSP